MRILLTICLTICLTACNSSGDKNKTGSDSSGITTGPESSTVSTDQTIAVVKLEPQQIPAGLKFRGKVQQAWNWKDKLGDNILILSVLPPRLVKIDGEETSTIELFAYLYNKKDTGYKIVWKLNDLEKECGFDYTAEFIKDATSITDLDQDGVAETCVQYKLACRSDVSPAYMKLIMHEDSVKYVLKGSMWIFAGGDAADSVFTVTEKDVNLEKLPDYKGTEDDYLKTYGRYESEKDFMNAPSPFLSFARGQWLKFVKESLE